MQGISANTILGIFILPSVVFALVYFPIVTQLSRGLLSPYAKADVKRRLFAATTDGLLVVTSWFLYWNADSVLYLAAGATYLLFRDAIKGQSIGKFLLGLVVISLESGRPCSPAGSVGRNLLFLLPGANVVAFSSRRELSCEIRKVSVWETGWHRPRSLKAWERRTSSSRFRTGSSIFLLSLTVI